jgi:hypothetical protein
MRKLMGRITCPTTDTIPKHCTLYMYVFDNTNLNKSCVKEIPIKLAEYKFKHLTRFPIDYEIDYEDKGEINIDDIWYEVIVHVKNSSKTLLFSNEYGTTIVKNDRTYESEPIPEIVDIELVNYE